MFAVLPLAIGDLANPRIVALLLRSLVVTLLIFVMLGIAIGWALAGSDPCAMVGEMACPLDGTASGIGAVALTLLGLWFLFPAVALGVMCAYVDRIAAIIEARHYPAEAARARTAGIAGAALLGLRSAGRVLLYNLVALPFYIVLLVTGIGPLILFILVNGAAFGRDLGEMVAARHGDRVSRLAWLGASRGTRMLIGSAVTALFLLPFVNLIAPVLGVAMTTHLYMRTRAR